MERKSSRSLPNWLTPLHANLVGHPVGPPQWFSFQCEHVSVLPQQLPHQALVLGLTIFHALLELRGEFPRESLSLCALLTRRVNLIWTDGLNFFRLLSRLRGEFPRESPSRFYTPTARRINANSADLLNLFQRLPSPHRVFRGQLYEFIS